VAPTDQSAATSCSALVSYGRVSEAVAWVNRAMVIRGRWNIVRVCQPLTTGTRGAGDPHTPTAEYLLLRCRLW
jgi:hypothetical protein